MGEKTDNYQELLLAFKPIGYVSSQDYWCALVQLWYSFGTALVQLWYSSGIYQVLIKYQLVDTASAVWLVLSYWNRFGFVSELSIPSSEWASSTWMTTWLGLWLLAGKLLSLSFELLAFFTRLQAHRLTTITVTITPATLPDTITGRRHTSSNSSDVIDAVTAVAVTSLGSRNHREDNS